METDNKRNYWRVFAGNSGNEEEIENFLKGGDKGYIGLRWEQYENDSERLKVKKEIDEKETEQELRDFLKDRMRRDKELIEWAKRQWAGDQLRLIRKIQCKDAILLSSGKNSPSYYIGKVVGKYDIADDENNEYRLRLPVEWRRDPISASKMGLKGAIGTQAITSIKEFYRDGIEKGLREFGYLPK